MELIGKHLTFLLNIQTVFKPHFLFKIFYNFESVMQPTLTSYVVCSGIAPHHQ